MLLHKETMYFKRSPKEASESHLYNTLIQKEEERVESQEVRMFKICYYTTAMFLIL